MDSVLGDDNRTSRVHDRKSTLSVCRSEPALSNIASGIAVAEIAFLGQGFNLLGAKLFLRSRLWGDEAGDAIVDDKLAVVFARMLDETVGHV